MAPATQIEKPTQPLSPRMTEALRQLDATLISASDKGVPGSTLRFDQIGAQRWNVLDGQVPLPLMVLRQSALEHNITLMQSYCDKHGAWLAPHGKTTMAPQLWAAQLRAGAWAITVANINQFQVCRAFGLERVLIANQLISEYDIRYVAQALKQDQNLELYAIVDSLAGIERLRRGLQPFKLERPLNVLVELGMTGGRSGVRTLAELLDIAGAVLEAEPTLWLAGVEGYEGVASGRTLEERVRAVKTYLAEVAEGVRLIKQRVPARPLLVSAGGSMYFDCVVDILGHAALSEAQLVLRSGGYVTHDSSLYDHISPLGRGSPRFLGGDFLIPALEVWSTVLSRPEPELAILGMGGRDAPADIEMPLPLYVSREGSLPETLVPGFKILKMNDQHAFLHVPPTSPLAVGDVIGCGISHPCTAFDKWRMLYVVDDERKIIGGIRTYF